MTYLYGGKILRVDLTRNEAHVVPTSRYADKHIGGRGINARMLYESVDRSTEPLGPDNIVCLGAGPLSGTLFPGCSRTDVMCKSPVTGLIGNSSMGGDWAAELKHAGWDHVVLEGRADHPVYIYIRNDRVEIRDAGGIWGETTYHTQDLIREELDSPDAKVVSIGPAGENQCTFATIHSSVGNAAARTGNGAVLGSKNCKALVVRGTQGVKVADPDAFLEACLEAHNVLRNSEFYAEVHTIGSVNAEAAYVRSGIECGGDGHADAPSFHDKYYFREFYKQYALGHTGCTGCPVHCMDAYSVPGVGATVISCELYPQLCAELRIDDMKLWYEMVRLCQMVGIDNTSMAMTIQWLMELHHLGILNPAISDGVAIEFGSSEAVEWLMRATVKRTGFGDIVARGMKATAEYLDGMIPAEERQQKSTYEWAMQVNNNPMYGINPRVKAMALSYSIGRRSDCIQDLNMQEFDIIAAPIYPDWSEEERELAVEHDYKLAAELTGMENAGDPECWQSNPAIVHDMGVVTGIPDMVGSCKWHTKWLYMDLTPEHYAGALTAGLGRDVSAEDLIDASLRLRNVERALECKMGRRRGNDTIPAKEFGKPVSHGLWKGQLGVQREELEKMKDMYYELRGWDLATGIPLMETLLRYGLEDVAQDLTQAGILPQSSAGEVAGAAEAPPGDGQQRATGEGRGCERRVLETPA